MTITIALYPSKRQAKALRNHLHIGRQIFNRALEERIKTYKDTGKGLTCWTQMQHLTRWRHEESVVWSSPVVVERDALLRLDGAFQAFFRRVKTKKGKAGFPRFKSSNRWHSFAINHPGQCIRQGRIRVTGVDGLIRCRNLRPIVGGVKVERILHKAGKWSCQLVIEDSLAIPPLRPVVSAVGIDVGLNHFATFSSGNTIENPRFLRTMTHTLRRDHQRISRRKKGSRRRAKAVLRMQRTYETLQNHRRNFAHHVSKKIVRQHQLIAIEDLNISNMVRGHFAKSILDAGWGQLGFYLSYKAARAGCQVIRVNPRGTSQDCSGCGTAVPKDLSERIHKCPACGLVRNRDVNAALNILRRAGDQVTTPGAGRAIRKARGASVRPGAVLVTGGRVETRSP